MFLAINELKHSRFRYLMVGAIITLIAWLAFLLAGLANGLVADTGAALLDMKADHLIFQSNVRLFIHRSVLPEAMVNEVRELPGVTAATPLGHLTIVVTRASDSDQIEGISHLAWFRSRRIAKSGGWGVDCQIHAEQ